MDKICPAYEQKPQENDPAYGKPKKCCGECQKYEYEQCKCNHEGPIVAEGLYCNRCGAPVGSSVDGRYICEWCAAIQI